MADIRSKLDHLAGSLDGKADRADVANLHQRIDGVEARVSVIERETEHRSRAEKEEAEERRYKVPVQLTVLLVVLTVALIAVGVVQLAVA